jgi:AcrR family transcriptional regulator
MEDAQPSRRERRRIEIRERIVETAFLLFETQGYEATPVTEIAERADIAYGTLFQHFPSKLDLLREVSGRALLRLFENVEEVSKAPGDFSERLVLLFDRTAENAESMGPSTRELISAMLSLSIPETADADDRRIRIAFRRFLEAGLAAGEVREDEELETLVEVVVGSWYSLFLGWVRLEAYPLRDRAAAVSRFLARTIATTPSPV